MNYRVAEIPVEHHRRRYGKSKYGFERFSRGALDVLTMWFLKHFRHAPGHFFGKLGGLQFIVGGLAFLGGIAQWIRGDAQTAGIVLVTGGVILSATGALTVSLGLLAELVLRHFVRIDPAVYEAENSGH
jgi:dolichol-phosphate mannosyltransferase